MQTLRGELWSNVVKKPEVEDPLSGGVEKPSSKARAACQLSAGEEGAQSLRVSCDSRVQNYKGPIMRGKIKEAEGSADLLEGPRLADTGAKGAGGERVSSLNNLVYSSSPPPPSQLLQAD